MAPPRRGLEDEPRDDESRTPSTVVRWPVETLSTRSASAWEKALAHHLTSTALTVTARDTFHGRLRSRGVDVVRLLHLEVQPHRLQAPASQENPSFQFVLPVRSSAQATQAAREAVVGPGSLAMVDTTLAYELGFDDAATAMVMRVPRQHIAIPPALLRQATGSRIGLDGDLAGAIMPLLVRLADDLIVFNRHSPIRLAYHLTDLLTTVLLEHLAAVLPQGSSQRLMLEVTSYLDEHLGDGLLSAESVASAHYISPRYLRKLFEGQHLKISGWVRERRLEWCRRQLLDPALADEPISVIAARWGFPDPAHFSRLFKATYGHSPRQFRRDGLHQDTTDRSGRETQHPFRPGQDADEPLDEDRCRACEERPSR